MIIKNKIFFLNRWTFSVLFFLVTRNYFKNYMLVFTNFLIPSVILIIFWAVFEKGYGDELYIAKLLPGLASSAIFSVGLVALSSVVSSWKKSVIFKKLKASPVPNWYLPFALILFYLIISFLSFWIVVAFSTVLNGKVVEQIKNINTSTKIINLFLGIFFTIFISCLIGLFIGFIAINQISAQAIGLALMLLTAFLLGCYIPPDFLISNQEIGYVSLASPHYSPIKLIQLSWFEGGVFSKNTQVIKETIKSDIYEMSYRTFNDINKKWNLFSKLNFKWQIQVLMGGWTLVLMFINFLIFKFLKNK